MKTTKKVLERAKELDAVVSRLEHVAALLEWDQETYLPPKGIDRRAAQIAMIMGIHHDHVVDKEWQEIFDHLACSEDGTPSHLQSGTDAAFVRECYKRWQKKTRVPKQLVEEMAQTQSLSQAAWVLARKANDFSKFQPHLEKIISLQKEYAQRVSPGSDTYDTLLDAYEPGAKGDEIAAVFDVLSHGLRELMLRIRTAPQPDTSFLDKSYPVDSQNEFGVKIQKYMGYDTQRGRLDISAHPFSTTLGPDDVRVTTRYAPHMLLSGLFSNIHEAGHGLYEQGIDETLAESILAEGSSLGIHESQSRFWENVVGRSQAFWNIWFNEIQTYFPENLSSVNAKQFYRAVNRVMPSLIRVEADEVTYSFHIIIRFRLERALIRGELSVADLPQAWNDAYSAELGIVPTKNAEGCLQDVHWSVGLFGYFPTYALGNLYSAQFTRIMERDLGPLSEQMHNDRIAKVLGWLRTHIHCHGRIFSPDELCRQITGEALNPHYFLQYLDKKYSDVYDLGKE